MRYRDLFKFFGFAEKVNNELSAHGDTTPVAVASLKCDNPEQEMRHHRFLSAGTGQGDRCSPLLHPVCIFIAYPDKMNSPEPENLRIVAVRVVISLQVYPIQSRYPLFSGNNTPLQDRSQSPRFPSFQSRIRCHSFQRGQGGLPSVKLR